MTKKRVRSVPIYVWVRPDELEVIRERMAEAGIRNMSAYIRLSLIHICEPTRHRP